MPLPDAPGPMGFPSTHWSLVRIAGDSNSPGSAEAIEDLCEKYWYPLYAFVRRKGSQPQDAEDLVQGFFAALLANRLFRRADPGQGRLRTFLLACLRSFLSDEWRKHNAAKRGQGRIESLEAWMENAEDRYRIEPQVEGDPARIYDQVWILNLIERSLERLARE